MKAIGILFGLLCFLAGCGQNRMKNSHERKNRHASKAKGYQQEIDADQVILNGIKYDYVWTVDVPIPEDATERRNYNEANPDTYTVGYRTYQDFDDLVDFYKQQMDLLGWHCCQEIIGLEALLVFENSHKTCSVSIREHKNGKKSDIVIMQKTI